MTFVKRSSTSFKAANAPPCSHQQPLRALQSQQRKWRRKCRKLRVVASRKQRRDGCAEMFRNSNQGIGLSVLHFALKWW